MQHRTRPTLAITGFIAALTIGAPAVAAPARSAKPTWKAAATTLYVKAGQVALAQEADYQRRGIPVTFDWGGGLRSVIEALAKLGQREATRTLLEQIEREHRRPTSWLAKAYGAIGDREQVDRLATSIDLTAPANGNNAEERCNLAGAYELLGDTARADTVRATMEPGSCDISLALAASAKGNHDRADALALSATGGKATQMDSGTRVALAAARARDRAPGAADALARAVAGIDRRDFSRLPLLSDVAIAYVALGDVAAARAVVATADELAQAPMDDLERLLVRDQVIEAAARAGDQVRVRAMAERWYGEVDPDADADEMVEAAWVWALAGDTPRARALIAVALRTDRPAKQDALEALARQQALEAARQKGVLGPSEVADAPAMEPPASGFTLVRAYLALGDVPAAVRAAVTAPGNSWQSLLQVADYVVDHQVPRSTAIERALKAEPASRAPKTRAKN